MQDSAEWAVSLRGAGRRRAAVDEAPGGVCSRRQRHERGGTTPSAWASARESVPAAATQLVRRQRGRCQRSFGCRRHPREKMFGSSRATRFEVLSEEPRSTEGPVRLSAAGRLESGRRRDRTVHCGWRNDPTGRGTGARRPPAPRSGVREAWRGCPGGRGECTTAVVQAPLARLPNRASRRRTRACTWGCRGATIGGGVSAIRPGVDGRLHVLRLEGEDPFGWENHARRSAETRPITLLPLRCDRRRGAGGAGTARCYRGTGRLVRRRRSSGAGAPPTRTRAMGSIGRSTASRWMRRRPARARQGWRAPSGALDCRGREEEQVRSRRTCLSLRPR